MANIKSLIPNTTLLGHDDFRIVWENWMKTQPQNPRHIHFANFDRWLFKQGGQLVQRNKKKCIEFIDQEDALVFKLKWL